MADGRPSVTHYATLEAHRFACLLEVHLETGRTHQIRVHMAALKHPCVGDHLYGADPTLAKRVGLERQWLHAVKLGFEHPESGEYVEYESTYPDDLARALEVIRGADRPRADAASGRRRTTSRLIVHVQLASRAAAAMPPGDPPRARGAGLADRAAPGTTRSGSPRPTGRRGGYARMTATWLDDLYVVPGPGRPGARQRAARPGQGPAARRLLPVGLRDQHPGPRLLRPARPGRARAHRRLRQRGEAAGRPDGLARHRPARRSTAA